MHNYTRINNIKNVTRRRDSRSAKSIETSRDDSIKQFSNSGKICKVELCTELFCAIITTPPYISFHCY